MRLESKDFANGKDFPKELGCDGFGLRPELHWSNVPSGTKSFAVVVSDPDAPRGTYYHWLVCNIPATANQLPKGNSLPAGAMEIKNTSGSAEYIAPCPPSGTHRYFFTVFALSTEKLDCNNIKDFLQLVEKNKIEKTEILATFKRK